MIDTTGMTNQQVSDSIAGALIKQGVQCMSSEATMHEAICAYSDGKGNNCAVGQLMKGAHAEALDFGGDVDDLIREYHDQTLGINGEYIRNNVDMMRDIQLMHDSTSKKRRGNIRDKLKMVHRLDTSAWDKWIDMGNEGID